MSSVVMTVVRQLRPPIARAMSAYIAKPALCAMVGRRYVSGGTSRFDEKEQALEELFVRRTSEKQQKILLQKLLAEEREQAQLSAREDLYRILLPHVANKLPESTIQELLSWKDKYARFKLAGENGGEQQL